MNQLVWGKKEETRRKKGGGVTGPHDSKKNLEKEQGRVQGKHDAEADVEQDRGVTVDKQEDRIRAKAKMRKMRMCIGDPTITQVA